MDGEQRWEKDQQFSWTKKKKFFHIRLLIHANRFTAHAEGGMMVHFQTHIQNWITF